MKPGEAAQVDAPWQSKIAALSTFPEPTRLFIVGEGEGGNG